MLWVKRWRWIMEVKIWYISWPSKIHKCYMYWCRNAQCFVLMFKMWHEEYLVWRDCEDEFNFAEWIFRTYFYIFTYFTTCLVNIKKRFPLKWNKMLYLKFLMKWIHKLCFEWKYWKKNEYLDRYDLVKNYIFSLKMYRLYLSHFWKYFEKCVNA